MKIKNFFQHTAIKSIILTILPLVYSSLFGYIINPSLDENITKKLIIVMILIFVVHIIALIIYGRIEHREKKQLEEFNTSKDKLPMELEGIRNYLQTLNKVSADNANSLYDTIKNEKGHSDIKNWHWIESKGDDLCTAVYNLLIKIAEKGDDFAVSMLFKKVENGVNGITMMSRHAKNWGHTPRIYRGFISNADADGYYYKKLFDNSPTRPQVLINKAEIRREFKDCGDIPYSQYVALPISCKGNKMIGILQISAYNDSIIAQNKEKLKKICNDYFSICTTLMLLSDKNENIQQLF